MVKKNEKRLLRVTLVKSPIGFPEPQKRTVKALGLRRMNQTVEHNDTPRPCVGCSTRSFIL